MFRFRFTLFIVKIIQKLMRMLHRNATNLPGRIAIKMCPDFLKQIAKPEKIVAVTGTDGKTTTTNLIIDALENSGEVVLNNKLGSNIAWGIASTFISGTSFNNKTNYKIAVLEVDERSAKKVYPYVKPTYLICTNLFRDSIYRNANPEFIFDIINKEIPKETKLILNGDDPLSSQLGKDNEKIYFAIDKQEGEGKEPENIVNDLRICPKCQTKLKYNYSRYNHIGNVYCPNCDFKSPESQYVIKKINYQENNFVLNAKGKEATYKLISDSMFNIYNELALITFLYEYGFSKEQIENAVNNIKIVNSRYNVENVNGINIIQHISKGLNAIACSCVFDYLRKTEKPKEVILIFDDIHDAKDSSENITWIYDTDFEFLNNENIKRIIVGGKRAKDYLFRLLQAGIPREKIYCELDQYKTAEDVSLDKKNDIYILFDIYNDKIADKIKNLIIDRINSEINYRQNKER